MENSKKELRIKYINLRNSISENERQLKSDKIFEQIKQLNVFKNCSSVFIFYSNKFEVSTINFVNYSTSIGKKISFPTVISKKEMKFYNQNNFDLFQKSEFGILEPPIITEKESISNDETLFIVPGLAFGEKGERLGYGGGFYDCYLSNAKRISTIGVCFSNQISLDIPMFEFDVKMDYVATENNIYEIK